MSSKSQPPPVPEDAKQKQGQSAEPSQSTDAIAQALAGLQASQQQMAQMFQQGQQQMAAALQRMGQPAQQQQQQRPAVLDTLEEELGDDPLAGTLGKVIGPMAVELQQSREQLQQATRQIRELSSSRSVEQFNQQVAGVAESQGIPEALRDHFRNTALAAKHLGAGVKLEDLGQHFSGAFSAAVEKAAEAKAKEAALPKAPPMPTGFSGGPDNPGATPESWEDTHAAVAEDLRYMMARAEADPNFDPNAYFDRLDGEGDLH